MIRMQVSGRLGKDPEIRQTQSQMSVCNLSIGSTRKYKDQENTSWIRAVVWGKSAEVVTEYFKKGDQIICWGEGEEKSFDKEGQQVKYWELRVEGWEFGAKKKGSEGKTMPPDVKQSMDNFDLNDVPF